MNVSIVGAGSVGLLLAARLAQAGASPLLVTRRASDAQALGERGLEVVDPASGERARVVLRATADLAAARDTLSEGVVLLAVRATDTDAAAEALSAVAPEAHVVSAQNDVDNEERLAERFAAVSGLVVRQTSTRMAPDVVHGVGRGRLIVGPFQGGRHDEVAELARLLRNAGYDVGESAAIGEDKWLKLCVNLMTSVNALVRRPDHESQAFVETKARLLEEARDALAAAGVRARSCDGRDRSLDDEITAQRAALSSGTSARPIALYNGVWTALSRPGTCAVEADRFHERILSLADRHGVSAPVNRRVLDVLRETERARRGPESVSAEALLP